MGKSALILGAASAVVVIACGAGGAIYALNASNSDNTQNKTANYELQKEQAKLNGWNQKDGAWYYYKDDKVQTGWVQDNGSWYYLDDSGKMKLNWIEDKNKWYYLGSDGKLRTGWIKDNDKWYYMNSDGTMAVNTTVDGNYLNANGLIEETPKPQSKQSADNNGGQTNNSNSKHVLSVEEARQLAVNYLNNHNKGDRFDNTYHETEGIANDIEAKYNCYLFVPEDESGGASDIAICVNKSSGQLYRVNPIDQQLKLVS